MGRRGPTGQLGGAERLIDAAERCIDRFGLAKTTLEDVATEASVSASHDLPVLLEPGRVDARGPAAGAGALVRPGPRRLRHAGDHDTEEFARAIVESSAYLLATIRGNSKLQVLLNQEGNTVAATVAGASPAFFVAVREDLRPHLEPAQQAGLLRAELDLDEASEWILRSILSLITVEGPVHRSAEDEKELLTTFLVPALVPTRERPADQAATVVPGVGHPSGGRGRGAVTEIDLVGSDLRGHLGLVVAPEQLVGGAHDQRQPGQAREAVDLTVDALEQLPSLVAAEQEAAHVLDLGVGHQAGARRASRTVRSAMRVRRLRGALPSSRVARLAGVEVDVATLLLADACQELGEHRVVGRAGPGGTRPAPSTR